MRVTELLTEAKVNKEKYVPAINVLLKRAGVNLPISPGTKGFPEGELDFFPSPNQQISSLKDPIEGEVLGKLMRVPASKIVKSDIIKNLFSGSAEEKVNINRGEVAEGYHAAAVFAQLIKRPLSNITLKDIQTIVSKLENGKTLTLTKKEVESTIADKFELTIRLKPTSWEAFKNPETVGRMGGMMDSIINDANSETSRFSERFATNAKFDTARVIGDGVSDESERKADVQFINQAEKKFAGFSLKTSTTKQVHQVGGGSIKDSKRWGPKATPEERYNKLAIDLFAVGGRYPLADISPVKNQILKAQSILDMQKIAYQQAVKSLNTHLQTNNQEKAFMQNLVGAMQYWIARDDPTIKLKQFTNTGSYILDPTRIKFLIDNDRLDLEAKYWESDEKGEPRITIYDKNTNKPLVTIRTKMEDTGYYRNVIEKEKIWVLLTKIKDSPNVVKPPAKVKQPPVSKSTAPPVGTTATKPVATKPVATQPKPALKVSQPQMGQEPVNPAPV